jgi:hypothetical protein
MSHKDVGHKECYAYCNILELQRNGHAASHRSFLIVLIRIH